MAENNPFTGPQLDDSVFDKASMVKSEFNGVDLTDASFYAVLKNARFNDSNLQGAEFDDVNLGNAIFNNINLAGAKFSNINFANVEISDANLEGMKINGILVSELLNKFESS